MKEITNELFDGFRNHRRAIRISMWSVFAVCVVLMVVASFADYRLMTIALHGDEWWSWWLQDWGEWPALLINVGAPFVLAVWLVRRKKYLWAILPIAFGMIFGYFFSRSVLDIYTQWVRFAILFAMLAVIVGALIRVSNWVMGRVLYLSTLTFTITNLVYFVMLFFKWLWGRVRPRDYFAGNGEFSHWFVINGPNGHEAFFSGHVLSALSLCFAFLIPIIFKIKNKFVIALCFVLPIFYSVSMMRGRMVTGAHYLSDVVFSVIALGWITVWSFMILNKIMNKKKAPTNAEAN